MNMVISF